EGKIEGKIAGILQLLEMKFGGKVPATLRKNIRKITEIERLDALFSMIFHAKSVEEVKNYLKTHEKMEGVPGKKR
ncbi:MAG: hypothetical protein Q4D62_13345, partial [Planctomycetia bacterium]|nr:hypothetical protein [Planctomycetia bacterium]